MLFAAMGVLPKAEHLCGRRVNPFWVLPAIPPLNGRNGKKPHAKRGVATQGTALPVQVRTEREPGPEDQPAYSRPVSNERPQRNAAGPQVRKRNWIPVSQTSKGSFWTLHSEVFPFSSMSKRVKRAKRTLYGISPEVIPTGRGLSLPTEARVELLNSRKLILALREIAILASRRVEQGISIRKELKTLFACQAKLSREPNKHTMYAYLGKRYAKHCVKTLLNARRAWDRWIPAESAGLARTHEVRTRSTHLLRPMVYEVSVKTTKVTFGAYPSLCEG